MRTLLLTLVLLAPTVRADDTIEKTESAVKAAAGTVAASVVKIETAGGTDKLGTTPGPPAGPPGQQPPALRKGTGPTTGVVVAADGYIITSSFNFANKPTDIFVTVPGRPGRLVAKQIATDTTRLLTLIKIDAKDLPVPKAVPKAEIESGQWSIALGRTLTPDVDTPPSISVGVISAVGRLRGKALQTDAKVSPVNYGGPLVDISGRVQGILVPGSTRGEADTTGVEWYDSGIGFAIPFEDVLAVLPRLKQGKDLRSGLMGITNQNTEMYLAPVVVGTVSTDSPAAKAGLKVGDTITTIDGQPVPHYVALQHLLGPKYAGDTIRLTVSRGGKELTFEKIELAGVLAAVATPFLGILPLRDDPDPGVAVRFVYAKSAADQAGLKPGDRILKVTYVPVAGQDAPPPIPVTQGSKQLATIVSRTPPNGELKLEIKRAAGEKKTETITVKPGAMTSDLPPELPLPSSAEKALGKPSDKKDEKKDEKKEEPLETGLLKKKNAVGREFWVYVPTNYTPNISHGVIVWLHPAGKGGRDADDMIRIWKPFLENFHYLMIGPKSAANEGWVASETEAVTQDVKDVISGYTVDRTRIIAHGMGVGGQMGFYLGFNARDLIRGVATTGAALASPPKENLPNQPLQFFIVGGEKDPAVKGIADGAKTLEDRKFPVIYRQLKDFGKEYMLQDTLIELCVWIDSLDKL